MSANDVDTTSAPVGGSVGDADAALGPIDVPVAGSSPATRPAQSGIRGAIEWVVILGGALGVSFLARLFLVATFYIPSPSMVPTLRVNDRIIVNRLSYRLHDVHRGDVVVFTRSKNMQQQDQIKDLIKRVIAVPGDTVESRGDTVFVNDRPVTEPYRQPGGLGPAVPRQTMGAHQLWVMGDNRTDSFDSRFFGPINETQVVGRAFVRIWPPSHLGGL